MPEITPDDRARDAAFKVIDEGPRSTSEKLAARLLGKDRRG